MQILQWSNRLSSSIDNAPALQHQHRRVSCCPVYHANSPRKPQALLFSACMTGAAIHLLSQVQRPVVDVFAR